MKRPKHISLVLNKTILVFLASVLALDAGAENRRLQRYEISLGGGLSNFMGDICAPQSSSLPAWAVPGNTTGFIGNLGFKYNLGKRDECDRLEISKHHIGLSLSLGQLRASDPTDNADYWSRGIGFNSFFIQVSARYEWYFIKEKPSRMTFKQVGKPRMKGPTRLPSYLFAGGVGLLNFGKYHWGEPLKTEGSIRYSNIAPVALVGIGTKLKLQHGISFGLELSWNWAISDDIDYCNGKDDPTPEKKWPFGKYIDQHQFLTINVAFKVRENKRHLPDFKSIGR